jgi:hypothetical protein
LERRVALTVSIVDRNQQARLSRSQPEKNAMNTITLLLGACALAALSAGTAGAGPCTAEIDNVTKLLASKDAGAGPTAGGASTTTGQHPPSATMGAADPSTAASSAAAQSAQPQHPPTAAMNQAAQGSSPPSQTGGSAREQHPPTTAMGQATQGGAVSPQDVQSQSRGGPTAAQQAQGARNRASDNLASIQAALSEARGLDQGGKESECMDAITRAKRLAG